MGPLPLALQHRGVVTARAFLVGSPRRALELWEQGCEVFRVAEDTLLVRLARPVQVQCDQAAGAPLVEEGAWLVGLPLSPAQRGAAPAEGGLVVAHAGRVLAVHREQWSRVDPTEWIDVGELDLVEVQTLGAPPPPPVIAAPPVEGELRAKFGEAVPARSDDAKEFLDELRRKAEGGTGGGAGQESAWGRLLRRVGGWLARPRPAGDAGGGGGTHALAPATHVRGPLERLGDFLHSAIVRLLVATRVSRLLGRRQGEYVKKMLELFERGDLVEALKHAIPVGGPEAEAVRAALGTPDPRKTLAISPGAQAASTVYGMESDLIALLRERYRAAFARLERQGRIDEAAFVLTELLHENYEAVSFLERHGRLELAAEIAEARELSPGVVVRQWIVAGKIARAVTIARRLAAFAEAVALLEQQGLPEAESLRLLWAEALAEAGEYARAVEVMGPKRQTQPLVALWLERALLDGGPPAGRMLALRAALRPELMEDTEQRIAALLEDDASERRLEKVAFADALVKNSDAPPLAQLARLTARALLRGGALAEGSAARERIFGLAKLGDMAELPSDLPRESSRSEEVSVRRWDFVVGAGTRGALEPRDAIVLPSGRILVALGEGGVVVLASDGRVLRRIDAPAHALIASPNGARALAVAWRGSVKLVHRLELDTGRAVRLFEAPLDAWANEYDGGVWYVAQGDSLLALDALGTGCRALWRVDRMGGGEFSVLRVAWGAQSVSALVDGAARLELWRYELPKHALRDRLQVSVPAGLWGVAITPHGEVVTCLGEEQAATEGAPRPFRVVRGSRTLWTRACPPSGQVSVRVVASGEATAKIIDDEELVVRVRPSSDQDLRVRFEGGSGLFVRFTESGLCAGDSCGRLFIYAFADGQHRVVTL